MPRIFVSYRRDDAAYPAQSIWEAIQSHFGPDSVVFDVDTIPLGVDFRKYLSEAVSHCDALLAVIGDHWLDAKSADGKRRLDDPKDFVRIEIEEALQRGIPVIPVLVGRATIPDVGRLPQTVLRELTFRQAAEVRPGRDYRAHLQRLITGVERVIVGPQEPPVVEPQKRDPSVLRQLGDGIVPSRFFAALAAERATHATPRRDTLARKPELPKELINSIGMKLVLIPAGTFLMGAPDHEEGALDHEKPQHRVSITKPFYMGIYPVTQREYEAVMGVNPARFMQSNGGGPDHPVETVSWDDAANFSAKLSALPAEQTAGREYRLPTEAEWEYACRAGSTTPFYFGGSLTSKHANLENAQKRTSKVGQYPANSFGLFDMHGNIWEWCADWYGERYYAESPASHPLGSSTGSYRVLRGGGWSNAARNCRSADRGRLVPWRGGIDLGFRVAASPSGK